MKQEFQQAIVAARSGKVKESQFLLAQVLQDDPQDAQAWFLLSQLVDDEHLQQDYLSKVLAIEPNHEHARQQMDLLEETAVVEDLSDLDRVMADMETTDELASVLEDSVEEDDWLAATIGEEPLVHDETDMAPPVAMLEPELDTAPEIVLAETEDKQLVPVEKTKPAIPERPVRKEKPNTELEKLNRQLYILVGLVIIILIIFLFTVLL